MKTKILIIRFSSIGDIVLTTPIARCIKQQLDDVEIHFLTKAKHLDLIAENPYIDQVHLLRDNLTEIIPSLKAENFQYVIDLHNNFRSQVVKKSLRSKCYTLDKINIKKWLLVHLKVDVMPNLHIVDRMFHAVAPLGIQNDYAGLDHFIPKEQEYDVSGLPDEFNNGFIAVVLAGTYYTKRLPAEKHIEFINKTKLPFILLGGKSEKKLAEEIVLATSENVFNLCAQININQSASVVKQARLVIANDTGLMHIAAAFRKKILSVWGSTTPAFGMYPYLPNPDSKMLKIEGLKCQPCSKIGKHKCPKKHFNCMLLQNTDDITQWLVENF